MDSIINMLILTITTMVVIVVTLVKFQTSKNSKKVKLPPGKTGFPIIGETLAYVSSPQKFTLERMTKHSKEIFKTSVAGGKMAVLCGPLGNKFLFSNETNKLVTSWWPKSVSKHLIFPSDASSSSSLSIQEDHSFLKLEAIQQYVGVMDSMAKQHLETRWAPHSEVKVHPLSKEFTFALACRLFINYENPDQVRELAEPFFQVAKGIMSVPLNIPGTSFNGVVKGGANIKEKLLNIIKDRREELQENGDDTKKCHDLLSRLLVMYDDENEKEIANKIIGYLLASFYTTSTSITCVLNHLADHPYVYAKVLEEQLEITKSKTAGELLNWGDIQKMKYSWNVVCESMRLSPPAQGAFKEVNRELTYAGFTIPKGWKVSWSVHSTYHDPKYFSDPEKFDPSRFEGNGPAPYTYVPFGGGPRMCVGKEYARVEILAFVHNVITKFKWKKVNPNEEIVYNPEPLPVEGMRIFLQPLDTRIK